MRSFACVPQADPETQALAISSLATYVGSSAYFICLSGPWKHVDNGSVRDVRAWADRGWCRLELAANVLSVNGKRNMIVAESPSSICTYGAVGLIGHPWLTDIVGEGQFTVEADRKVLGPVVAQLIAARKAKALSIMDAARHAKLTKRVGQLDIETCWYRMLHCKTRHLLRGTGYDVPVEATLDEWLKAMRFESVHNDPVAVRTGQTAFFFAAISDRVDLAGQLLDMGCDLYAKQKVQLGADFMVVKGVTAGVGAAFLIDSPEMIQFLLARGFDPRHHSLKKDLGFAMLDNACLYGQTKNIDALLAHDSSLFSNVADPGFLYTCPVGYTLFMSQHASFAHLLERHPEQMRVWLSQPYCGPSDGFGHVALACFCTGDVRTLRLLLDTRLVDVNVVGCATGKSTRTFYKMMDLGIKLTRGLPFHMLSSWAYAGARTTALHIACFNGNLGAVELLLGAHADALSAAHPYKMTPLHLAAMGGHEAVVDALLAAGADVSLGAKDNRGKTPEYWARRRGHTALADRLKAPRAAKGSAKYQVAPAAPVPNGDAGSVKEFGK